MVRKALRNRRRAEAKGLSLRAYANGSNPSRHGGREERLNAVHLAFEQAYNMTDVGLELLEDAVRLGREATATQANEKRLVTLAGDLRKLARVWLFRGELVRAQASFEEAILVTERLRMPLAYAVALCRRAREEEQRQDWPGAEVFYRRALSAAYTAGEPLASAFILSDIARLRGSAADADGELAFAHQALQRYQQLGAASAGAAIEEMERRRAAGISVAIEWCRRVLGNNPAWASRAYGVYPRLGMQALQELGAVVLTPGPGPDSMAEICRLRARPGAPDRALVTSLEDLTAAGTIEQRIDDFESDDIPLTE